MKPPQIWPTPVWIEVGGRRLFVVGWTSGGAPYGVFEDEMDVTMKDLDKDGCDQPPDFAF